MRKGRVHRTRDNASSEVVRSLLDLERRISDAILLTEDLPLQAGANLFGRERREVGPDDMGTLSGMVGTGWRTALFVRKMTDLVPGFMVAAVRRRWPVVVHTREAGNPAPGWILLQGADMADAVRLTLVAHRVAELTLSPVLLVTDPAMDPDEVSPVRDEALQTYLGTPSDLVESVLPAQEMVFGRRRRRIPVQFSPDLPVLWNVPLDAEEEALARASREVFWDPEIRPSLEAAEDELTRLIGGNGHPVRRFGSPRADRVLRIQGSDARRAEEILPTLGKGANRWAILHGRHLCPWPEQAWTAALAGVQLQVSLTGSEEKVTGPVLPNGPAVYTPPLGPDALSRLVKVADAGVNLPAGTFLDIRTIPETGGSARREVTRDTLVRLFPELEARSLANTAPPVVPPTMAIHEWPAIVRSQKDLGPPYSRLSRFHSDVTLDPLAQNPELRSTDPFQALPVLPPLTARLHAPDGASGLAVLQASACTACGACLAMCPHSALLGVAHSPESLIRSAMSSLQSEGQVFAVLPPMVRNLARLWAGKSQAPDAGLPMDQADAVFAELVDQAQLEGEKRDKLAVEWASVVGRLQALPWVAGEAMFRTRETVEAGSGVWLGLAIDPDACTGCGLCAESCPEQALEIVPVSNGGKEQASNGFRLWESLPDTPGDVVRKLDDADGLAPMTATLLSRHYATGISGGTDEPGLSAARVVLRLLAVAVEAVVQPQWSARLASIHQLRSELEERINGHLRDALPDGNHPELLQALQTSDGSLVDLEALLHRLSPVTTGRPVDTGQLQRWIRTGQELGLLSEAMITGASGTGRSRYGLVLGGPLAEEWVRFPDNPFQVPVWVQSRWNPDEIRGILSAWTAQWLDEVRLLRRAALEAQGAYRPEIHDAALLALRWADLKADERLGRPSLLVAVEVDEVAEAPTTGLLELLGTDWPVQVLVLRREAVHPAQRHRRTGWLMPVLWSTDVPVFQTSPARMEHLSVAFRQGAAAQSPVMYHVLAPTAGTADSRLWPAKTAEMVTAGLHPLVGRWTHGQETLLAETLEIEGLPDEALGPEDLVPPGIRTIWDAEGTGWADALRREWTLWLEMAGRRRTGEADTTKQVRESLERQSAREHEESERLHRAEIERIRQGQQEDVHRQLTEKLVALVMAERDRELDINRSTTS